MWLAQVIAQLKGQRLAKQIDAFVDDLEVLGQSPVTLTDLPQQMLRLVVEHVQIGKQIEQGALPGPQVIFRSGNGLAVQVDVILNTKELAAVFVVCVHGDSLFAPSAGADQTVMFSVTCRSKSTGCGWSIR